MRRAWALLRLSMQPFARPAFAACLRQAWAEAKAAPVTPLDRLQRASAGIVAIKEAVGTPERIRAIAQLRRPGFGYLSGDDGSAVEAMLAGAGGVVSVVNSRVPERFRWLCDAACSGDRVVASGHHARLAPLLEALDAAPNPIPVKAGLAELGLCRGALRLPLVELPHGPARARLRDILLPLAGAAAP